jgi:O-antigen/teichoic acid export membrane protein
MLKSAFMLSLKDLFAIIYIRGDVLLITKLLGFAKTALYGASVLLLNNLIFLPQVLPNLMFIFLNEKSTKNDVVRVCYSSIFGNLLIAFPLLFGGIFLSDELISFVFREEYQATVVIFRVLLFAYFVHFINYPLEKYLVSQNDNQNLKKISGFAAILFVVMSLFMLPFAGVVGQAFVVMVTQVFIYFFTVYQIGGFRHKLLLKPAIIPLVSSSLMLLLLLDFPTLHLLVKILVGLLSYTLVALGLELIFYHDTAKQFLISVKKLIFGYKKE